MSSTAHGDYPPTILLTMGDPSGIGPEIIAQLYARYPEAVRNCIVVGDVAHLRRAASVVQNRVPFPVWELDAAWSDSAAQRTAYAAMPAHCIPVLQGCTAAAALLPYGQVAAAAGRMAGESVAWAANAVLAGRAQALVTAPLHKEALHLAGYSFPGHTEYLQHLSAQHLGKNADALPVRMMLANHELRTVLLSIHVSLRQALEALTPENLWQTLLITQASLTALLSKAPRIAVAGLNPHAGEGGQFGDEERHIIAPAVARAQAQGWQVSGPYAPDTIFMRARRGEFDVVIAMYHDQGLIPVKYLGLEQGVNVTLGLPLVRTSPDHGTAFDIAGQGLAQADSMLAALHMARALLPRKQGTAAKTWI